MLNPTEAAYQELLRLWIEHEKVADPAPEQDKINSRIALTLPIFMEWVSAADPRDKDEAARIIGAFISGVECGSEIGKFPQAKKVTQ